MNTIQKWMDEANKALPVLADAKAKATEKQTVFNRLAFGAVQILAQGKIQDEKALAVAVSKEGKYQALRGAVSKAKPLAQALKIQGFIVHKTKKEEKRFTLQEVNEASENPLFSVSSVYSAMRKEQEALTEGQAPQAKDMTDKDFIEIALEAEGSGLTVKEALSMSPEAQAEYTATGKAIYEAAMLEKTQSDLNSLQVQAETILSDIFAIKPEAAVSICEAMLINFQAAPAQETEAA